jgi:hypothetical protein
MIKNVTKKVSRGKLTIEVETLVKQFYVHPDKIITDEEMLHIANETHDVVEVISRPTHEVGNYINSNTKQKGTWVFRLKTKKTSTKTSLRGKINKIAKDLNNEND